MSGIVIAPRCQHPMAARAWVKASQYFPEAGQTLQFFTGDESCGLCGAVFQIQTSTEIAAKSPQR